MFLENLNSNGHSAVDRVSDDTKNSIGAVFGTCFGQSLHNGCIGVEQIVTGHSWFSGNTGWDENQVHTGKGLIQTVCTLEAMHLGATVDVTEVSGDTWRVHDVVQIQLRYQTRLKQTMSRCKKRRISPYRVKKR